MTALGTELLLAAIGVMLCGAALQSAVGFGMGMATVPILLWLGVPLAHAVAFLNGASIVQAAIASHRLRHERQPSLHLRFALGQWLGLPLGLACMGLLSTAGRGVTLRAIGVFLLVAVAARALLRPRPRAEVAPAWTAAAALSSGMLTGTFGMGGPPMVFWSLAHQWTADRVRAFLLTQSVLVSPAMLGLLVARYGADVLWSAALGLGLTPALWAVTATTQRATAAWPRARLQTAALALITLLGLRSLVG